MLLTGATNYAFSQPVFLDSTDAQNADSPDGNAQPQSPSSAQAPAQPPPTPTKPRRLDCQHPADPHRRRIGCKDEEVDWDETLSKSWNGIRSEMRRLGLTPALSYTGVLQTNATGGPHPIWGFAGQLSGGLDINLEKLLKVRGMSVYVGASWGAGDNLSGPLHNLFPVNSLYAPTYYLGEMYLQQTLLNKNLTLVEVVWEQQTLLPLFPYSSTM